MSRRLIGDLREAEQLLQEVRSWSEEEVEELPKLYREKAREYRRLQNRGED
jgi:Tfp pilus assembly protein PilP